TDVRAVEVGKEHKPVVPVDAQHAWLQERPILETLEPEATAALRSPPDRSSGDSTIPGVILSEAWSTHDGARQNTVTPQSRWPRAPESSDKLRVGTIAAT